MTTSSQELHPWKKLIEKKIKANNLCQLYRSEIRIATIHSAPGEAKLKISITTIEIEI